MMTNWKISPYVGVGLLKFGMSPADVTGILGEPSERRSDAAAFATQPDLAAEFKDSVTEFRKLGKDPDPILQYRSDKLVGVDFHKNVKSLELGGLLLFDRKRQTLIDDLIDKSDNVFETFEGYIFLDFGINMQNSENSRTNPNINAFARGEFNSQIKEFLSDDIGEFIKGNMI